MTHYHLKRKSSKKKRHKVELELEKPERINELRWIQFKADRAAAEERAAKRLKILENAISKHRYRAGQRKRTDRVGQRKSTDGAGQRKSKLEVE